MSRSNLLNKVKKGPSSRPKKYNKSQDKQLILAIQEIITQRPSYGYRRVTSLLRKKLDQAINPKKVYRIMKSNDLLLSKPIHKSTKAHNGKVQTLHSNTRWCSDSFSIQCFNGERVHVAFSIDSCDRELMRYIASTIGIDGKAIRDLMLETVEYRFGKPKAPIRVHWLSDKGEMVIHFVD